MRFVKLVGIALGVLLVVLVAGMAYMVAQFDGPRLKAEAVRIVQEKTQRTLQINGDLSLSFWPTLGVQVGQVVLSEPRSDESFAALDEARVSVAVLPLLDKRIQVSGLHLKGLRAIVVRRPDGSLNISDLLVSSEKTPDVTPDKKTPAAEKAEPLLIDVAGVSIADAALTWRDEQNGGKASISGLRLSTGQLTVDSASRSYSIADLQLALKGLRDSDDGDERFEVLFESKRFALTPTTIASSGAKFSVVQASAHRYLNSRLSLSSFDQATPGKLSLDLEGFANKLKVSGKLSSPISADREKLQVGFGALNGEFKIQHPQLPPKEFKLTLDGRLNAHLAGPSFDGQMHAQFDGSQWGLKFDVPTVSPLAMRFALEIDRLDLNRYLPQKSAQAGSAGLAATSEGKAAEGAGNGPDLALLDSIDLQGDLRIGSFQAAKLRLADLKLHLQGGQGRLALSPITATLYGGKLNGSLAVQAADKTLGIQQKLQGIDVSALLADLAGNDLLTGNANVTVDLKTRVASAAEMKRQLAGSAHLAIGQGALKGVNLARTASELQALFGNQGSAANASPDQTEFGELTASFRLANGVAHNDDLLVRSQVLLVKGEGVIDIGGNRLNYLLKTGAAKPTKSRRGKAVDRLKAASVPVRLSGPLDKPVWAIDQTGVLNEVVAVGIEQLKQEAAGEVGERLTDTLKGLFGR